MEWVETTGRTLEEAVESALDQLGVTEADVEYEIVEEPRGGLFRRGEARIRARVKPVSREKPRTRRPRSEQRGRIEKRQPREPRAPRREPVRKRPHREKEEEMEGYAIPVSDQAEVARKFCAGMAEAFGHAAEVAIVIDDEEVITCNIAGSDLGHLIGHRGTTMFAIEELTRAVVQRQTGGRSARVNVDVAGYRARRREALAAFATDLAHRVAESGKAHELEPMSSIDRKVVHDAVAIVDGVTTTSEGEDRRRRVVIVPE